MQQREIKFKIWDYKSSQWDNRDLALTNDGKVLDLKDNSFVDDTSNMIASFSFGFLDKNGKEIYEGDLISEDDEYDFSVCGRDDFPERNKEYIDGKVKILGTIFGNKNFTICNPCDVPNPFPTYHTWDKINKKFLNVEYAICMNGDIIFLDNLERREQSNYIIQLCVHPKVRDENGKIIYIGDAVSLTNNRYTIYDYDTALDIDLFYYRGGESEKIDMKVLGNALENPEFLNRKDDLLPEYDF